MSLKSKKIKGLKHSLKFEISKEDFNTVLDTMLKEHQKQADIKGFRKGHAPLDVIRQKYEEVFIGKATEQSVQNELSKYLQEANVRPVAQPNVELDEFNKDKGIKFSAEFEVFPELKDINFEKIKIEKKVSTISDKNVESSLKQLQESRRTTQKLSAPRASKKGDIAIIDYEGFVDGVAFDGGKGAKHSLELGSKSFIEGFEDQLIGKNIGDDVDVNVTFPKPYHSKELEGKKAVFKVKIVDVREKALPKLDDELAISVGRKDLKDLKSYIEELLKQQLEVNSRNFMKDDLLEELAKLKIDLPETLVEQEFNGLWAQTHKAFNEGKLPEDEMKKGEKKLKAEAEKNAEKRVKLGLLISKIGQDENVKVEQADVQGAIMQEAMKYPGQQQQVMEFYQQNPQALNMIRAQIYENKVLDAALAKVSIKEKKVDAKELNIV